MARFDEDDFQGWKVRVLTFSGQVGFAGALLVITGLATLVGCSALFYYAMHPGTAWALQVVTPGVVAAVLWFQLSARLFYQLHALLRRQAGPREAPVPRPPLPASDRGRPGLRCAACGRRTAARWRKCPFCLQSTGMPRGRRYFQADARLDVVRSMGLGASLALAGGGAMLGLEEPWLGLAVAALAAVFLVAHLLAVWHPAGWVAAFACWCLLAAGGALWLARGGGLAALAVPPLAMVAWMGLRWRSLWARLLGREDPGFVETSVVPTWTPCVVCGSREAELVAPLVCMSVGVATMRWPLEYRSVCLRHARWHAVGPSLLTLLVGWWGIPWGPVWTVEALLTNLDGGVTLDSALARELRREEEERGATLDASFALEFVLGFGVALVVMAGALAVQG